jgi:hypothetical protein
MNAAVRAPVTLELGTCYLIASQSNLCTLLFPWAVNCREVVLEHFGCPSCYALCGPRFAKPSKDQVKSSTRGHQQSQCVEGNPCMDCFVLTGRHLFRFRQKRLQGIVIGVRCVSNIQLCHREQYTTKDALGEVTTDAMRQMHKPHTLNIPPSMQFLILPRTLIIFHILRPHPPSLSSKSQ